jgi:putative peptide zinc metalloprotease protein
MIRRSRRKLAIALLLLVCAAGPAGLAAGQDSGGDTSAVAINTRDGSSVFKLAFQIRKVTGDVVDNQNAAVAYASCTECQTVAISIQVLLVAGSPTVFTPENIALAINEQCTLCDTMALAYQFAVGMDTQLKFTAEGNRQLAQLRRELEQLRTSDLSLAEIEAKAADIVKQLSTVLSTELVGVKPQQNDASNASTPDTGTTDPAPTGTTPTDTTTAPATTTPTQTDTTPTDTMPTDTTPTDTTTAPTTTTPTQTDTTPTDTTTAPGTTTP